MPKCIRDFSELQRQREEIGARVRKRREQLGIDQKQLSKRLNYKSSSTITQIENGQRGIPASMLNPFAEQLHCNVGYILGFNDDPNASNEDSNKKAEYLNDNFSKLNEEAQNKLIQYMNDLMANPNNLR